MSVDMMERLRKEIERTRDERRWAVEQATKIGNGYSYFPPNIDELTARAEMLLKFLDDGKAAPAPERKRLDRWDRPDTETWIVEQATVKKGAAAEEARRDGQGGLTGGGASAGKSLLPNQNEADITKAGIRGKNNRKSRKSAAKVKNGPKVGSDTTLKGKRRAKGSS